MKNTTTDQKESKIKNIWATASILAELIAPALLIYEAYKQNGIFRATLAVVGSILIVNVITKIHTLNRR